LICKQCEEELEIMSSNSADLLSKNLSDRKVSIQNFWGDLCKQWYTTLDENLDTRKLKKHLKDVEDLFAHRKLLPVTEINLDEIAGKSILEIGSGSGGHSALFKKYRADIVSVDITPQRVRSTALKLSLLNPDNGVAFVADAENLPFHDESFDIVYSNGVLHHSENTNKCIKEVYRVLKPNGKAVIMLYSRHSVVYWLNLFIKGVFSGTVFRLPEEEWLGRITEGKPKYGETKNPITRVYSKKQIENLFMSFKIVSIRKGSFMFSNLPKLGFLRNFILNKLGYKLHPGGILVYGKPLHCETKVEHALGKYVGFCWNIVAIRKT
jgi:ubiquinone/menaquinone biosynthesis C-methylase UbiE